MGTQPRGFTGTIAGGKDAVNAVIGWMEMVHRGGGGFTCAGCGRKAEPMVIGEEGVHCCRCRPGAPQTYTFDALLLLFQRGLVLLRNLHLLTVGWLYYSERVFGKEGAQAAEGEWTDVWLEGIANKERSLLELDWLVPSAGRVNALVDARGLELEPAGQPWEIDIEVLDAFYQLLAALASRGMGQGRP